LPPSKKFFFLEDGRLKTPMIIWYFQSRQNGIVVVVVELRLDNSTAVKEIICTNRNIIIGTA
jgi:hypothetical protein